MTHFRLINLLILSVPSYIRKYTQAMPVHNSSTIASSGSELQYAIVIFIVIDIMQGTHFQWKVAEVSERDPPYVVWKLLK
jgi:hypothetical protein